MEHKFQFIEQVIIFLVTLKNRMECIIFYKEQVALNVAPRDSLAQLQIIQKEPIWSKRTKLSQTKNCHY